MASFINCRICLKPTDVKKLNLIYEKDGQLANEIFLVTGVQIIDMLYYKDRAYICDKCLQYLEIAVKFRSLCKKSDLMYRKITCNIEEKSWSKMSKNLLALQTEPSSLNEVMLTPHTVLDTDIKCEILENLEEYEYIAYEIDDTSLDKNYQNESIKESPKKEDNQADLQCKICGKWKSTINLLKLHLYRHRVKDPKFTKSFDIKCSKCAKKFRTIKNLEIHMSSFHQRKENLSYTCDYCGECFFNRAKFKTHLMEELKNMKFFACAVCNKEFKCLHRLKCHERLHVGWREQPKSKTKQEVNELQCTICKGFCKNKHGLRKHMRDHKNAGEIKKPKISLKCKFCGWVCPTEDAIRMHYYNHRKANQEHNILCTRCDESFFSYRALLLHNSKYHKIKGEKFFCDHCDRSFYTRSPLTKHLKEKHFAKKRIKLKDLKSDQMPCSFCGKIFISLPGLKNHEEIHLRTKPLEHIYCDLCGNRFLSKTNLRSHMKFNHIENRRFYCPECPDKSWINNCALRRHIDSVHNGVRHVCTICGRVYHHIQNLRYHYNYHYAHIEGSRRSQLKPKKNQKAKKKKC